jgi:hypothetical protein
MPIGIRIVVSMGDGTATEHWEEFGAGGTLGV